MVMTRLVVLLVIVCMALVFTSCGSSDATGNLSAEDRFELGKKKFEEEDYLEAISDFEIIKLQYPGSAVADDAQFYLAECRFNMEEYLFAAEEYLSLRRSMPASSFVPLAQYKVGLCYYRLSPKSSLDQKYTYRAIDEFQAFLEYYPQHEMASEAEAKIKELTAKLAKKLYDSAELYMKLGRYKAATDYFNSVLERYHDTPYADLAFIGKVKSLIVRKKYDEAKRDVDLFLEKYPNSHVKNEVEALKREIEEHLKTKSAVSTSKDRIDLTAKK
ncbi:MAG: outer membrane protein assembly factor BamD [Ignavibacteriae bacterium]|nr:outer membrane protein assembly factor BamD [Ignavibacteriota bacterium]